MQKPVYEDLNYQERFDSCFEELTWLYGELYRDTGMLQELFGIMYRHSQTKKEELPEKDPDAAEIDMAFVSVTHTWVHDKPDYFLTSEQETIPRMFEEGGLKGNFPYYPKLGKYVMTDFKTDQWSLNYRNPKVFQEMVCRLLEAAKEGVKVLKLKNLPFIWKELGTDCCDRPGVHAILRLLRLILETVCPEVEIWAVLELDQEKAAAYLGTKNRPQCHRIWLTGASEVFWHSLATRDGRLLRRQMELLGWFSGNNRVIHALMDTEDFQWRLDYRSLSEWGMEESTHRKYLNDYFAGLSKEKWSIISMCGLEKALEADDIEWQKYALRRILLLYACIYLIPGVPVLQLSRPEEWSEELGAKLQKLELLRDTEKALGENALCRTVDVGENSVLCIIRESEKEKVIGLFNFSEHEKVLRSDQRDGIYRDLISGEYIRPVEIKMPGNGCYWLKKE